VETLSVPIGVGSLECALWLPTGRDNGRLAVLLHGFPFGHRCWTEVGTRLAARGWTVAAPDQRGYAAGARPADPAAYRVAELSSDVLAVAGAVGARVGHEGPFDLVGHDFGATVAWYTAVTYPDRLRTLTAASVPHPAAFESGLRHDRRQRLASSYLPVFQKPGVAEEWLLDRGGAVLRELLADVPGGDRYADDMLDRTRLTGALSWYRALDPDDYAGLGPCTVPTVYLWGADDEFQTAAVARRCEQYVTGPYRFVVLRGMTHWIPLLDPGAIVDCMTTAQLATAPPL
jgi:pimeloyl-ACP methyl ester carboxylesterase